MRVHTGRGNDTKGGRKGMWILLIKKMWACVIVSAYVEDRLLMLAVCCVNWRENEGLKTLLHICFWNVS